MKRIRPYVSTGPRLMAYFFGIALMTALVILAGCSKEVTSPETNNSSNILNDPSGGFTTTNEAAGFGDPSLIPSQAGELAYVDPVASTENVDSLAMEPKVAVYHLRILWGHLAFDSTELDVTDWSGSLTTTVGCEVLRRVIRFEEGDSILPRTDRKKIEWLSHTRPHNDGIAVDIVIPPPHPEFDTTFVWVVDTVLGDSTLEELIDTVWQFPVTPLVSFQTPQYSRTFTLDELVRLDTIVALENGNEVAFMGFKIERFDCPKGFIGGRWGYDDSGNGVFSGIWSTKHGPVGSVLGRWGTNDAGEKVFFGKWISEDGKFEGLLRGRWWPHPDDHADSTAFAHAGGAFAGKIFDNADVEIGVVRGLFGNCDENDGGGFAGRWKVRCRNGVHDDMQPPPDDGMGGGM